MTYAAPNQFCTNYQFDVYDAAALQVVEGVNRGEPIGSVPALCLGDCFILVPDSTTRPISLRGGPSTWGGQPREYRTKDGSKAGDAGANLCLAAKLTFMTAIGTSVEAHLFHTNNSASQTLIHPLSPMCAGVSHTLIDIKEESASFPLIEAPAMSFGRGTRITMADGAQRRVETLQVGERVLTRDGGMQPIRWTSNQTVRGAGAFAPVQIMKGALGNAETFCVGQHQRMMICDWRADALTGTRDALICAGDLVNDDTITLRPGGYVDYTQLVFDQHEVVYAEGVPAESLSPTAHLPLHLSEDAAAEVQPPLPELHREETLVHGTTINGPKSTRPMRVAGQVKS